MCTFLCQLVTTGVGLILLSIASQSCKLNNENTQLLVTTLKEDIPIYSTFVLNLTSPSLSYATDTNNILILYENKTVLVNKIINYKNTTVISLKTRCSDSTSDTSILFTIEDTDNTPPVWTPTNKYVISISENIKVPYILPIRPKTTDDDSSGVQEIYQNILPGNYSNYFSLESNRMQSMNITLIQPLDYETVQKITLNLQAEDHDKTGKVVFITNATLEINVQDEDDMLPIWRNCTTMTASTCEYKTSIFDNSSLGSVFNIKLDAIDGDVFINTPLDYGIISEPNPKNFITLNINTGEMILGVEKPTTGEYKMIVQAIQKNDRNKKSVHANVIITVFPATYMSPWFEPPNQTIAIDENLDSWSMNLDGKAQVGAVTYKVETRGDYFTIDSNSGKLSLRKALDYENITRLFTVISADDGKSKGYTTIQVNVTNLNDNNPEFSQPNYHFYPETREKNKVVGTVLATDKDGDTLTYKVLKPESIAKTLLFDVNAVDGRVNITADPQEIPDAQYTITVVAQDPDKRESSVSVQITFPNALTSGMQTASISLIPFIVIGCVFGVVVIVVIVAFIMYKQRSDKEVERAFSMVSGPAFSNSLYYGGSFDGDAGATSLQDNPIEGFDPYGADDGENDMSTFRTDRQISEIFLNESLVGETTDYGSVMNGSIRTMSSAAGSQKTLINGSTTKRLHAGSNLEVVQVENAVDTNSGLGINNPGLTVYL